VSFAGYQFDAVLSYDEDNRLHSVTYMLPSDENAEMMAFHAYQLIEKTQDAWGCSYGTIFSNHRIEFDLADLIESFGGTEPWREEVTWIVDKDISDLELAEGNCVSVRFCADNPGDGKPAQIRFEFGADTAASEDFVYDAGVFSGIYK